MEVDANERSFWDALEFRVTAELAGSEAHRGWWCDGFAPEEFALASTPPLVRGTAWLGATGQETWTFELRLVGHPARRETIEWDVQLPAQAVTGWLTLIRSERRVLLDPGTAVPDAPT